MAKNLFELFNQNWLKTTDTDALKKYTPEQLITSARSQEELFQLKNFIQQGESESGGQYWWQKYHEQRLELGKSPSRIAPNKWVLPQQPEEYVRHPYYKGQQRYGVSRNLYGDYLSYEQVTGKAKISPIQQQASKSVLPRVKNPFFFDLETSGLLKEDASILSFGTSVKQKTSVAFGPLPDKKYSGYIKNVQIPKYNQAFAASPTKIMPEKQILDKFMSTANRHSTIMGYNINQFDIPMLKEVATRHNLSRKLESILKKTDIVDVADYAKSFVGSMLQDKGAAGWDTSGANKLGINPYGWKLGPVAKGLGWEGSLVGAHAADYDAQMTEFVWDKLQNRDVAEKTFRGNFGTYLKAVEEEGGRGLKFNLKPEPFTNLKPESFYTKPIQQHLEEKFGKGFVSAKGDSSLKKAGSYWNKLSGRNKLLAGGAVAGLAIFLSSDSKENQFKFPAMGDSGTFAAGMRAELTEFKADFASRWDTFKHLAAKMTSAQSTSILKAGKRIKSLGQGQYGEAFLHEAMIEGKQFKYVVKEAKFPKDAPEFMRAKVLAKNQRSLGYENKALQEIQGDIMPSAYHYDPSEGGRLYMEYMPGKTLKELAKEGSDDYAKIIRDMSEEIEKTAGKGWSNIDIHEGNIMYDPVSKRTSWIDWGMARPGPREASMEAMGQSLEATQGFIQRAEEGIAPTLRNQLAPTARPAMEANLAPTAKPPGRRAAIERNKRFRESSRRSVGIGLRSTRDGGKGHREFGSLSRTKK